MKHYVLEDWFLEADTPFAAGAPDAFNGGPPTTDPYSNQLSNPGSPNPVDMQAQNNGNANVTNQQQIQQGAEDQDDLSNDPPTPDMPEEKPKVDNFEKWRNDYLKESIKGDANKLIEMLNQVRDHEDLHPVQRKFIEDNWNLQLIRQNSNIDKASKEIRRNLKDQLDRNNPATSVVNHMTSVLDTDPTLNNIFVKLKGYGGLKGDLHRKYIGALLGCVQVGSGANSEDLVYNEKDYSILISTRFNSEWGDVMLGSWAMKEDDANRFLTDPERKRLDDGSPQEKDVLRRRILLESMANQFETRALVANVVGDDGTIFTLGWDLAGCLRAAYADGKLIVKTKVSDSSEAMITDEGHIVPFMDVEILYAKETGEQKEDGSPEVKELPFIERRKGMLFLVAELKTLKEAATSLQGMVFKEVPYNGNPSDLKVLSRCVYSSYELLMRSCQ